ncbi:813_t:CDS:2 [Cetraspora pellucida]|uniref:813_t:CDS:1 n=1 Tax=Cetraspora pellucida TaxID=1433469 RepID=A0A9N9EVS2_9GLOM|nr:813_t:CDS:2 [Cetraspora pellucida]
MEEGNLLSSSSVQSFDESFTNRPDSPSDKNEIETSERLEKVVEVIKEKSNNEVTCNVLNDSSIKCNTQLKIKLLEATRHNWNFHSSSEKSSLEWSSDIQPLEAQFHPVKSSNLPAPVILTGMFQ